MLWYPRAAIFFMYPENPLQVNPLWSIPGNQRAFYQACWCTRIQVNRKMRSNNCWSDPQSALSKKISSWQFFSLYYIFKVWHIFRQISWQNKKDLKINYYRDYFRHSSNYLFNQPENKRNHYAQNDHCCYGEVKPYILLLNPDISGDDLSSQVYLRQNKW